MRRALLFIVIVSVVLYLVVPSVSEYYSPKPDERLICSGSDLYNPHMVARPSEQPALKTIELTNAGELVDRCQWTDALLELSRVSAPKLVVVYVHGWKHRNATENPELQRFANFVRQLADNEAISGSRRHVVGIYLSWQASLGISVLDNLTYWNRKYVADRISQSAIVTKLIGAIENIKEIQDSPENQVVYVGHSFGARILHSATSQLLVYRVQDAHPSDLEGTYQKVRRLGDLVILINPAFESSLFTAIATFRRPNRESFNPDQQPMLVSISTKNDWANRIAFPVGQFLGGARQLRELIALGHFSPYVTHCLVPRTDRLTGECADASTRIHWSDDFCTKDVCLRRKAGVPQARNPFMVVTTEKEIVNGHNGLWSNPVLTDFVIDFVNEVRARDRHK